MDRAYFADRVNFSFLIWPTWSLLGGPPLVSTRKWGFPFACPFSSASVYAAYEAPLLCTGLFAILTSLLLLLFELPVLLLVLLLLLPLLVLVPLAVPHGNGGALLTSRCVERGARRGRAAIRAGSALIF